MARPCPGIESGRNLMRRAVDIGKAAMQSQYPPELRTSDQFNSFIYNSGVFPYLPETPIINKSSKLITIGSCCSAHVANALGNAGLDVINFEMSERIFTTFAMKELFAGILEDNVPDELIDDIEANRTNLGRIKAQLIDGATVIFTLGLSVCWFDRKSGKLAHTIVPKTADETAKLGGGLYMMKQLKRFEMRQTSVDENFENLMSVIETVKAINPANKVVLTVSPIPLQFCLTPQPILSTDFISKAVLRMAVGKIEEIDPDGVFYFPSFEIVRWASPHLPFAFWGTANTDGNPRHVDQQLINLVVQTFLANYADLG